ncbi:MAG: hypothetical protein Q9208_005102 [Pyrenodesmia sp. 3 TL-2023]
MTGHGEYKQLLVYQFDALETRTKSGGQVKRASLHRPINSFLYNIKPAFLQPRDRATLIYIYHQPIQTESTKSTMEASSQLVGPMPEIEGNEALADLTMAAANDASSETASGSMDGGLDQQVRHASKLCTTESSTLLKE